MKIAYIEKRFRAKTLKIIDQANAIIEDYQNQGYDLTLRQLYYQMVARDLIENTERSYKNFGSIVSDARMAGLIDWYSIIDRTRVTQVNSHWENPESIIQSAYHSFNMNHWDTQTYRPRVWIEKEALIGVIQGTCSELDVPYLACRGYMSQSAMWRDAQKAARETRAGYIPIIIHLGDHDPSGMDMTRDIGDRMIIFGVEYLVKRIALNYDQVEEQNPPPNPAKMSDSRASNYVDEFGYESWELDALSPSYINSILRETITDLIETEPWDAVKSELSRYKSLLKSMSENYELVEDYLRDQDLI